MVVFILKYLKELYAYDINVWKMPLSRQTPPVCNLHSDLETNVISAFYYMKLYVNVCEKIIFSNEMDFEYFNFNATIESYVFTS